MPALVAVLLKRGYAVSALKDPGRKLSPGGSRSDGRVGGKTDDGDLRQAIAAGITVVHSNTELRLAWHRGFDTRRIVAWILAQRDSGG